MITVLLNDFRLLNFSVIYKNVNNIINDGSSSDILEQTLGQKLVRVNSLQNIFLSPDFILFGLDFLPFGFGLLLGLSLKLHSSWERKKNQTFVKSGPL